MILRGEYFFRKKQGNQKRNPLKLRGLFCLAVSKVSCWTVKLEIFWGNSKKPRKQGGQSIESGVVLGCTLSDSIDCSTQHPGSF